MDSKVQSSDPKALEMELRHLGREAKTALELAIVGVCPWELMERISAAAGMLEGLAELPLDSPAVEALVPRAVVRAKATLDEWSDWQKTHLSKTSV